MSNNLPEEIKQGAGENQAFPIGFNLHDGDGNEALYIDEGLGGRNLYIEITNCSPKCIKIKHPGRIEPIEHRASHLKLILRTGILTSYKEINLAANNDWNLDSKKEDNNGVTLAFSPKQDIIIAPNQKICLILHHVCVNPYSNARVTQVKLEYENLKYKDETDKILKGSRLQSVRIMNHRGKENIPIHISFVGSHSILNDGKTPNGLKLRIRNISKQSSIPLSNKNCELPSLFIISFDGGKKNDEEALLEEENIRNIEISVEENWYIDNRISDQQYPRWILTTTKEKLEKDEYIDFVIDRIISSTPSGYANLYVRYKNIPGYWDGQFIIPVEKSPILYRGNNVGIGVLPDSNTKFRVGDQLIVDDKVEISGNIITNQQFLLNSRLLFLPDNRQDIGNDVYTSSQKQQFKEPLNDSFGVIVGQHTSKKVLTAIKFGFSIPDEAIIQGIVISFTKSLILENHVILTETVQLCKQENIKSKSETKTYDKTVNQENTIYGSKTDVWNNNWTPIDINNSRFGVVFTIEVSGLTVGHLADFTVEQLNVEIFYEARKRRPRDGYFAGKVFAKGIEVETIKIENIQITQKELSWLKNNAK